MKYRNRTADYQFSSNIQSGTHEETKRTVSGLLRNRDNPENRNRCGRSLSGKQAITTCGGAKEKFTLANIVSSICYSRIRSQWFLKI